MISVGGRSHTLATALKASAQVVPSSTKGIVAGVVTPKGKTLTVKPLTLSLRGGPVRICSGIGVSTHIRCAHTDLQVPDFSDVRKTRTLKANVSSKETVEERNGFTYLIGAGAMIVGAYSAKTVVRQLLAGMSASADVLALATIEINTNDIPEGKSMTFKWRGKPVFVKHRTEQEISTEQAVDIASLRDPQHDSDRVQDPKWLVVVGVCTHLGCVPIADAGDFGGYYCPCHGSHYDSSGRIRKGPAPLNLEVPEHSFPEPGLLIVG